MKCILFLIFLNILSIKALKNYNSLPDLIESVNAKRKFNSVFNVVCNDTWSVLAYIPTQTETPFPLDIFGLESKMKFNVICNCSEDQKTMKVTFRLPKCESHFLGLKENPIIFEIYDKKVDSGFVRIRNIGECWNRTSEAQKKSNTAYIGYVYIDNIDFTWYLLHKSKLENGNVVFGLIIFGSHIKALHEKSKMTSTLIDIGYVFFNNTSVEYLSKDLLVINNGCVLGNCYIPKKMVNSCTKFENLTLFLGSCLFIISMGVVLFGIWYLSKKLN